MAWTNRSNDYGPNRRVGCLWESNKDGWLPSGYINVNDLRQLFKDFPETKDAESIRISLFAVKNKKSDKSPHINIIFMPEKDDRQQSSSRDEDVPF